MDSLIQQHEQERIRIRAHIYTLEKDLEKARNRDAELGGVIAAIKHVQELGYLKPELGETKDTTNEPEMLD